MANQIKAPINYPIIAGGKIVSGGSVIFGQPNVKPDPDNPSTLKAVYLDAALIQQAENPQGISSDGVFDQSDTGILYGPSDTVYSIVILGANKKQLSYIPEYDLSDANAAATAQAAAAQAETAASNAIAAKDLTEALYADFTNRYFGSYSSDPSVDDLGNPPNEGSIYFNTVSDVFFTWNGSAWVNYFPSNPNGLMVTATGTTTPRSLADRFGNVINVRDFGAVGDGVTDDASAIREAVSKGGHILIPEGDWLINSGEVPTDLTPHNPNSESFIVVNVEGTYIEVRGNIIYRNDNGTFNSPNCFYISADNVTIEGGQYSQTTKPLGRYIHAGNAVAPYKVSNFTLKNATFNHARQGCILYNTEDSRIDGCYHYSDITSEGSSAAFKIRGGSGNTIESCTSYYGLTDGNMGIFGTGVGNRIVNCKLYNRDVNGNAGVNTRQGISIDSGQQFVSVIGNYVDDFFYCIDVKTGISGCQVIGNTVKSKKTGIAVRWGEGTQNNFGTVIQGNSVVMAEGITDPTPLVKFTPNNPNDDSGGYTTAGIYIDHIEGAVSVVGNTFTPDTADSDTVMRACGVVVRGNADTGSQVSDRGAVTITGNNFNFVRLVGVITNRLLGPAIGVNGDATGDELPNVIIGNNTYVYPASIDATSFSAIDAGDMESINISDNILQNVFYHGPFTYLNGVSKVNISNNSYGTSSRTAANIINCDSVVFSGNLIGEANLDAVSLVINNIMVGIISNNIFKRNSATGVAISNITNSDNLIVTGNYAEGAANSLTPNSGNTITGNNIVVT